jgi:hypothetical protein
VAVALYSPQWKPLADALKRVVAVTGISEQEAKTDICNAIADGEIAVKVFYGEDPFTGDNVRVPSRLKPDDFDWTSSRPFRKWFIGPVGPENYTWLTGWEARSISLIELSTSAVRKVLCNAEIPSDLHNRLINPRRAGAKPTKRQKVKEAMQRDIRDGTLDPATLKKMLQKNLAEKYGAGRELVCKVREEVLSEINSQQ